MKSPYVAELQPNQVMTAIFLVQHKDIRQKKSGEPYLSLSLGDRTGDVDAKMWDNAEEVLDTFERDDFVKIRGLAQIHQNRLQIAIQKLQRVDEKLLDLSDFFPASRRDPAEMLAELRTFISGITNVPLKALGEAFLNDAEITRLLKIAPAAKSMHHAYLGGLLEHMLSMTQLAVAIGPHYRVDLDLLLIGVLLHDIGKLYELTYDRSFGYSTDGSLLGHMFIGLRMLDEKIRAIADFPPKVRVLIEHMILSHHGQLEFGSPKTPCFPEALLLHHIDNLDSKMEAMRHSLEKDKSVEGLFTAYNAALERQILKKDRYLNPPPVPPQPPVETTPSAAPAATNSRPDNHQRRQPSLSPFASQLQQALVKGTKD